ncbi:GNAT family N-acetyltransferase, partial [Chromobacterium amazonense]|uniref:GNAT family N-acetyltransferase n=1 Tax=Chromobacterium amazonense TaxID=1382803 RepID=UPI003B9698E0
MAVERVAADVAAGWFHYIERAGERLGVVKIQYDDPLFWPDAAAGESVLLHHIAMRRNFAGPGVVVAMVRHALDMAAAQGLRYVGLDCDAARPALRAHYLRHGFVHRDDVQAGCWKVSRLEMETGRAHRLMDSALMGASLDYCCCAAPCPVCAVFCARGGAFFTYLSNQLSISYTS